MAACAAALALLLGSCAGTPTPEPTSVSYLSIATTPELESMVVSWVIQYRQNVNEDIIQVKSYSPLVLYDTLDRGESNLVITGSSPPDGMFVTPLGEVEVVVVINLENRVQSLGRDELEEIFSGRQSTWETVSGDSVPLLPIVPLEGDSTRIVFESRVMQGSAFSSGALLAPTPSIMLDLISEDQGAIGFMLANDIGDGVKQLQIDGSPSEGPSPGGNGGLWIDVLAVSSAEPQGNLRDFIVWIQANETP